MHENTYVIMEQPDHGPAIHKLGRAANSNHQAHDIEFRFGGAAEHLSEHDEYTARRKALEELYQDICAKVGIEPDDDTLKSLGNDELKRNISCYYRDESKDPNLKVAVTIFRVNPANKSGSFANALDRIETFTEKSKAALFFDALKHLATLDPVKHREEIGMLSDAVTHVTAREAFSIQRLADDKQNILAELSHRHQHLIDSLAAAESRYNSLQESIPVPKATNKITKPMPGRDIPQPPTDPRGQFQRPPVRQSLLDEMVSQDAVRARGFPRTQAQPETPGRSLDRRSRLRGQYDL